MVCTGKRMMVLFLTLVFMLCSTVAMAVETDPKTGARITGGKVIGVPSLSADGLLKKVKESKGKVVMVNIFASWCPPCRVEVPEIKSLRDKYSEDEVVILGVSVDKSNPALFNFMNNLRFTYPVYIAAQGFEQAFEIKAIPRFIIYNKEGKQVFNQEGLIKGSDVSSRLDALLKE